ncbi:MAG: S53 family peptidase, partial [Terriglobia bacterium]
FTLVFKPSPDQQTGLTALLQQLQNPASPQYHKWLTPDEFGSRFGLSQDDINKVVSRLQGQSFTVDRIARSRTFVVFSGTAGQVKTAFSTEIHHYLVNGRTYYANASDPTVPDALANVVLGFRGLDNFRPKPRAVIRTVAPSAQPHFTSSVSEDHYLAPNDWATIYDVTGLYNSRITGTGQSIAVMGQTDIYSNDITAFRAAAGLPASSPTIILIPGSTDPGISQDDLTEADLDLEWSGGIAPDATIIYVNSGTANGVFDSLSYTIDEALAPVVSITYGECEADWGAAGLEALAEEAEQANAQGMTIVAASGDQGVADCDESENPNVPATIATQGYAVDAPASVPYVTGVGGTEFNEGSQNYWSSTNNSSDGSALSYIPETAWNDTSAANGLSASGGGPSIFLRSQAGRQAPACPMTALATCPTSPSPRRRFMILT